MNTIFIANIQSNINILATKLLVWILLLYIMKRILLFLYESLKKFFSNSGTQFWWSMASGWVYEEGILFELNKMHQRNFTLHLQET